MKNLAILHVLLFCTVREEAVTWKDRCDQQYNWPTGGKTDQNVQIRPIHGGEQIDLVNSNR